MGEVLRIIVRGRVQGVGFRYFTQREAQRLGISGWVRNLPTGEVEVLADLPPGARSRFLAALRQGPPASEVDGLAVEPAPAGQSIARGAFHVRH